MYATFDLIISTPIEIREIEYSGNWILGKLIFWEIEYSGNWSSGNWNLGNGHSGYWNSGN